MSDQLGLEEEFNHHEGTDAPETDPQKKAAEFEKNTISGETFFNIQFKNK